MERITSHRFLENKTRLFVKLGIEIILLSIPKFLLIYGLAALLDIFLEVLIFDSAYFFIRRKAYGVHAASNSLCFILSILIFIGIPYLSQYFQLSNFLIILMFSINSIILSIYAPAPSKKNPISCKMKIKRLRIQALLSNGILFIIVVFVPILKVRMLISMGAVLAGFVILPIFKEEKKNERKD